MSSTPSHIYAGEGIHFEDIENALLDVCSQDNEIAYCDAEAYVLDDEESYDD
jgi:hypothetical protein